MGACLALFVKRSGAGGGETLIESNGRKSDGKGGSIPAKNKREEVDDDEQEAADDGDEDLIGYRGHTSKNTFTAPPTTKPSSIATTSSSSRPVVSSPEGNRGSPLPQPPNSKQRRQAEEEQEEEEEEEEEDDDRRRQSSNEEVEDDEQESTGRKQVRSSSTKAATPWGGEWANAFVEASSSTRPSSEPDDIIRNFIVSLDQGIVVVKHDRKGRPALRELYTPDNGQTFSWRSPSKGGNGHERSKSGNGGSVFRESRVLYPFSSIIEIRRGTIIDPTSATKETGTAGLRASCDKNDLYKSFSIILSDRTVDLTCHSVEQMTFLVKGFTAILADVRRKKLAAY